MESFADKLRAFAFALGLHLACILALLAGLWWTHETRTVVMPGPVIEASLVGPTAAPKPRSGRAKPAPAKPPKPEPPKPAAEPPRPPPTEVLRQDTVEREKVAALAQEKAAQEQREQEERIRQEQVELEQEQQRKLAEQRKQLDEIRKQRADAERKANIERERLAQLEDRNREKAEAQAAAETEQEAPQARTGAGGADDSLAARYAAAIQAAVTDNWNRPESATAGLRCVLRIAQIPGGEVISVTVGSPCNADPVTRNSIEQAVMKAAPLPYEGFQDVFQRNINFNFRYDG
ncbi:MAG: cell envelope integrity protein TolA [Lysobacteraceae bacterium]|nr:MAG: cell envelope integrity protein TolA [Xanthomonadaceae bacterium]